MTKQTMVMTLSSQRIYLKLFVVALVEVTAGSITSKLLFCVAVLSLSFHKTKDIYDFDLFVTFHKIIEIKVFFFTALFLSCLLYKVRVTLELMAVS